MWRHERIAEELARLDEKKQSYKLTINDNKELEISCAEMVGGERVALQIILPHGYPDAAPRIYAPSLCRPGRREDGRTVPLAIFGSVATWKPKTHDVRHALTLGRSWLKLYAEWTRSGTWPEGDNE